MRLRSIWTHGGDPCPVCRETHLAPHKKRLARDPGDRITAEVDDRGIELAEAAVYELRNRRQQGFRLGPLSPEEIDQALAALSAVRTLTKED